MKFNVSDNTSQPPHKGGDLKSQSVKDTNWRPGVRGAVGKIRETNDGAASLKQNGRDT